MKNLVCAGGGIKGFYYLGVIKALEEKNIINKLEKLCGVSVGAIIVVLIALNYSYKELYEILINYNFDDILEKDIFNMFNNYSIYGNSKKKKIIKILIKYKMNKENVSLRELCEYSKKKIYIIATNVETGNEKIFNIDDDGDVDIIDIVCASSALPILFPVIRINDNKYIDGGFSKNYPLDIFKNDLENTIGINIEGICINKNINTMYNYITNIIYIMISNCGKHDYMKDAKINVHIYSNENGCNFDITKKNKEDMIEEGYNKCMINLTD